jgi:hypothetical protein
MRNRLGKIVQLSITLLCVLGMTPKAVAQSATPFSITGHIQSFTVDNSGNLLSGGHITVNNIDVTIPTNTIVVFPAAYWTMSQVMALGPAAGSSGLGLNDVVKNPGAYEASISGNMVSAAGTPTYVAGDVHISAHSLQNTDGYIRSINYASGELCVGANPAPNLGPVCSAPDVRVRLNDPNNVYSGPPVVLANDTRFQVDPDNPTVSAGTGYPMCIPRSDPAIAVDPDCPIGNRPRDVTGLFLKTFVMSGPDYQAVAGGGGGGGGGGKGGGGGGGGALVTPFVQSCNNAPTLNASPTGINQCQPTKQAPMVPGDYISYSGVPATDGAISATAIDVNVGIYTRQGVGNVAYIKWGEGRIGTGPQACAAVTAAECQFRLRIVGFATDPSRIGTANNKLNFYYIDVNPVTGVKTTRLIIPLAIINDQLVTPLVKDQGFFGRFRIDITKKQTGITIPPTSGGLTGTGGLTRELLVSMDDNGPMPDGTPVPDTVNSPGRVKAHGLIAGQYWAPVPEFLFPEVATPGTTPPSANFNCLSYLIAGWSLNFGPPIGQVTVPPIAPWPGSALNPVAGVNCSTNL